MLAREPIRPAEECVCGKGIVELASGEYRSDESDPRVDRAACKATDKGRHQPRPAETDGRAIMSRVSPPWSGNTEPDLQTGGLP